MLNAIAFLAGKTGETIPTRGVRGGDLDHPRQHREWRNQPLKAPVIDGNIVGLHDPRDHDSAAFGLEKEKPWHRMAAFMMNRGCTNQDIAAAAGVTPSHISVLRAQRWFNELCVVLAHDMEESVRGRLDGYALEAVEEIANLARTTESDRVRLSAYTTLLEHSQGKPTQKIISQVSHSHASPSEEMEDIQQQLSALRASSATEERTDTSALPASTG